MFERNPVDNKAETMVAVEVSLADGSKIAGRAVLAPGKGVHKLLEGADAFIYVDGFDGEGAFVPKSDIRGLKVMQPGKPSALLLGVPDARAFDPYRVLGLSKGASFDDIRAAYHNLTKIYHPDRFASVELPREVTAYIEAMAKNVNAAFRALRYIGDKQPAIYTRGP
jgi:DnaJ domain